MATQRVYFHMEVEDMDLAEASTEQKQTHIILKAFILIYYTYVNFRRLLGRHSALCLSDCIFSYL